MLRCMPTTTSTPPAVALDDYRRAVSVKEATCDPAKAAAALDRVLHHLGAGSMDSLSKAMDKSRQTIRYWKKQNHDMDPEVVWQIAGYYASDPLPSTPEELQAALRGEIPGQVELFNLFYDDNNVAAATWLLTHRSGSFRWGNDVAA